MRGDIPSGQRAASPSTTSSKRVCGPRPHPSFRGGGDAAGAGRGLPRLTVRKSLDPALRGVGAVFLVWTAPAQTVTAVVERLAVHVRRVVFLSSPHQPPHPFFQQPNPMAVLQADIERLIAAQGSDLADMLVGELAGAVLGVGAQHGGTGMA
ncbi:MULTISPECIES: hypothetical protein [Streptomyces]|uniref:hypothetical protein n=1 Tax=Streptomyces TaxID=1883 RepID=UPI003439F8D2